MNSFANTYPVIKSLGFTKDFIEIYLADGRMLAAPLVRFPAINKLSASQRKKHHIIAGVGFDFDDSDEVYHISEFLGQDNSISALERNPPSYASYEQFASLEEPKVKYKKTRRK